MKKYGISILTVLMAVTVFFVSPKPSYAQTMGWSSSPNQNPPSQSDIQDEQNMQDAGLAVYQNLKSSKVTCQTLTSSDYEKLGEYFMGQAAGSTQNHVYWDNRIQEMMGDQGDTQMHIAWGERGSGCETNATLPPGTPSSIQQMMGGYFNNSTQGGGTFPMMGYGFGGYGNMMGAFGAWGIFGLITWVLVAVFLVLGIVYFWRGIKKPH